MVVCPYFFSSVCLIYATCFVISERSLNTNAEMTLYDQLPDNAKTIILEREKNMPDDLEKHVEGGSFREIYRDANFTVIQFQLTTGEVSKLHRLKGINEEWLNLNDGTLILVQIDKDYHYHEKELLKNNSCIVQAGKNNSWGNWFGAYTTEALASVFCICRPPFEYENFEILSDETVIEKIKNKNLKHIEIINKLIPA